MASRLVRVFIRACFFLLLITQHCNGIPDEGHEDLDVGADPGTAVTATLPTAHDSSLDGVDDAATARGSRPIRATTIGVATSTIKLKHEKIMY